MAPKSLKELLAKYTPPEEYSELLSTAAVISSRVDKEKRFLETSAKFAKIVDKDTLYNIEKQASEAYDLRYFRIYPKYDEALFSQDYIPEVLRETERQGVVARGFFTEYIYELDEDKLCIYIPFNSDGINLLEDAKTPSVISGIIESEFGKRISVSLEYSATLSRESEESSRRRLEEIDRQLAEAEKSYDLNTQNIAPACIGTNEDCKKLKSLKDKLGKHISIRWDYQNHSISEEELAESMEKQVKTLMENPEIVKLIIENLKGNL